jgi:hypothetical protein
MARERGYVRPRDLAWIGVTRPQIARLVERGLLERVGYGLYRAPDLPITEHRRLPPHRAALPRPDHAGPVRGLARHRTEDGASPTRQATRPRRLLLGRGVHGGRRGAPGRGRPGARLLPGEDGGRLLQVSPHDRPRRGAGGAAGDLAGATGDDGRPLALRDDLPRGERHAPLPGDAIMTSSLSRAVARNAPFFQQWSPDGPWTNHTSAD